jgi:hypothetical protein
MLVFKWQTTVTWIGQTWKEYKASLLATLEDHANVNRRASYGTLHLVDVSLSKRVYVFGAYVFECCRFSCATCLLCVM